MKDLGESVVSAESEDSTLHSKKMSAQSAISNGIVTARKSSRKGCKKDLSMMPQYGPIYVPSTAKNGLEGWILSLEDSHAKTSPRREKEKELRKGIEAAYGMRCSLPLALFDPLSSSWRMSQLLLDEDYVPLSEDWPKRGIVVGGRLYEHLMSERLTGESDGFVLPTITCMDNMDVRVSRKDMKGRHSANMGNVLIGTLTATAKIRSRRFRENRLPQPQELVFLPTIAANEGKGSCRDRYRNSPTFRGAKMSEGLRTSSKDPIFLNPSFGELIMGFPRGWTDLNASVTPWFPNKDEELGECSQIKKEKHRED